MSPLGTCRNASDGRQDRVDHNAASVPHLVDGPGRRLGPDGGGVGEGQSQCPACVRDRGVVGPWLDLGDHAASPRGRPRLPDTGRLWVPGQSL